MKNLMINRPMKKSEKAKTGIGAYCIMHVDFCTLKKNTTLDSTSGDVVFFFY